MLSRLVDALLRHPLVAIVGVLLLVGLGAKSYRELPIDAVPDVTNVQVQVLTSAPGLSPVEVERLVTQPVEIAMTGIPHVAEIRSTSRSAISAVTVVFAEDTDIQLARQLVAQRLDEARASIPSAAGRPQLGPLTTGLGEVYHFTIRWPGHRSSEIRTLLEWDIGYRLRNVPGVVEVNPWGGDERQVEVRLRETDMLALGVTPAMVADAILAGGQNVSAGAIERREEGTFVRAEAVHRSAADVAQQVVTNDADGLPILVQHVADVGEGYGPRFAAATADGQGETVYAMVQMIAGGNAHEVVSEVKRRLADIERSLPDGVVIEPLYDRASFVDEVLATVKANLLEGGVIVALVLLLMLGNLRAGLVVASVIPLAMLGAFAFMRAARISGNLLSLGAIDFGLVVDGAVVVVEGTLAAMATHRCTSREAVRRVAREVGRPVSMAVVIIAIVYLPVMLLEGVEGKLFRPMALTVLFAMGTALVLTFTWVPTISALVLSKVSHEPPRIVRWLTRLYRPAIAALVPRWQAAGVGVAVLLAVGVAVAAGRGAEFVPRLEEGDIAVQITRPPSVSREEAVRGTTVVEQVLATFPDVERVVSRTGSPDVATDVMGIEQSDVFVILKPRDEWTTAADAEGFAAAFAPKLERALPGAAFGFTQPIEMRTQELIGGVKADVGVKVFGEHLPTLRRLADEVARTASQVRGSADVRVEATSGLRTLTIRPEPMRMARLGVQAEDVLAYVETLRLGRHAGQIVEGPRRFDIMVRLAETPSPDPDVVRKLRVPLRDGGYVLLGDVADVDATQGPAQVSREQAQRRVLVEVNVRGRDLAGFVSDLDARLKAMRLPSGYYYELGGEYENLARASARLGVVVPFTLLTVLVLLYFAFGAVRPALLIFVNVPAAATGGFVSLWLRGLDLSISAAVGFLALFGVATLNGVVLVAAIRQRQKEGQTRLEAAAAAAEERLRPVLTTALVAALGFLPMAIATGTGAEVQRPLATVVIGGLVTATLVTLFALPALYARFGGDVAPERAPHDAHDEPLPSRPAPA